MKTYRILLFTLIASLTFTLANKATAEDCEYSPSSWSDGDQNYKIVIRQICNKGTDKEYNNLYYSYLRNSEYTVSITADDNGVEIVNKNNGTSYNFDNIPLHHAYVSTYGYDKNGNWIQTSYKSSNYNEDGSIRSYSEYNNGSIRVYTTEWAYEFDDNGTKIGYTSNDYNANGSSYTHKLYDEDGRQITRDYKEYDEEGRVTKKEEDYYDALTGQWRTVGVWHYDYNDDGSYDVYDDDGKKIAMYNADGSKKVGKRIYTVSEAEAALGTTGKNTFILRYR